MSENKEISLENDIDKESSIKDLLLKAIQEKDYNLLKSTYFDYSTKKEEHKFIFNFINQEIYLENDFIINLKGYCYQHGIGIKKDFKKAIELYEKAAQMNNSNSICNLANFYFQGIENVLEKNVKKSFELYEKAAKMNNSTAINNLGHYYHFGFIVSKDCKKAFELHEKAAQLNNLCAINDVAYCYKNGIGVTQDYKKAIELFEKAIEMKCPYAFYNLADSYEYGLGVTKDYNKALELYFQYHILTGKNIDHIIMRIIDKNPSIMIILKKEIDELKKENEELKKENNHLRYCPGLGYQEAKADFEILKKNLFIL